MNWTKDVVNYILDQIIKLRLNFTVVISYYVNTHFNVEKDMKVKKSSVNRQLDMWL